MKQKDVKMKLMKKIFSFILFGGTLSLVLSFFTMNVFAAETFPLVEKLTPSSNAKDVSSPVFFEWNSVPGADKYQIKVWENGQKEVKENILRDTQKTFKLKDGVTYWWAVRACHESGFLGLGNDCDKQDFGYSFIFTTKKDEPTPTDTIKITSSLQLPGGTVGDNYDHELKATCGNNCLWIYPAQATPTSDPENKFRLPKNLSLNKDTGIISGKITEELPYAKTFKPYIEVRYRDKPSTRGDTKPFSLTIQPAAAPSYPLPAPRISSTSPLEPGATEQIYYSYQFKVTGGTEPYSWFQGPEGLPPGLSLSKQGVLSGIPSKAGSYAFSVWVQSSDAQESDLRSFLLTVSSKTVFKISTLSLSGGEAKTEYRETLSAIGGITPYKWTIIGGNLPNGLELILSSDRETAVIKGFPTEEGTSSFTVEAQDSSSPSKAFQKVFSILISPEETSTSPTPSTPGTPGTPFSPGISSGPRTGCPTEGLVPCGTPGCPCTFCDFFDMINRIIQFVMGRIVPAVAVLMLVIGGVMFFFAGGSPNALATAKKIITSTIIGLVIILAAFLIVGAILSAIGLADWTAEIYKSWWSDGFFQIPCN